MARGQSGAADAQRATVNGLGASELGKASGLEDQLIPKYQSMLTEGYTPNEKNSITTGALGAEQSSYDSAAQHARNNAARTNNAADLTANEDQLARDQGAQAGQTAAGLGEKFADTQMANERYGLAGLSGLEEGNQRTGEGLYGLTPGLLNARAAGGSVYAPLSAVAGMVKPR